ncbi:MAG: hypothetical protein KJ579_07970 [Verrucomicrobia bacterium]|nr:hypothetical protein [Verrucomicrobiota bacterium]
MTLKAIEETRLAEGAGVSRGTVHRALAVFFVAGALLNGENLLRSAERMEHGRPIRSVWIAAARPIAAVSRTLGLGAPRRWIEARVAALDEPH